MARRTFTPEELQELRDLAAMEQIARAAATGLTEGTLQTLLEQQVDALGQQQPCPDCGWPCVLRRQPRPLQVQGARLQQSEPVCHCPDCRRDFFPPTADLAP
jgi:hypothetical protein